MSQTDWGVLSNALASEAVRTGPTAGVITPNGGGTHCFGMRSIDSTVGAYGRYCLQPNFSPTPPGTLGGGRITGALRRAALAGAADGFSPFLFFCAESTGVSTNAYILGLSNEAASYIELRKGLIIDGVPSVQIVDADASPNVLMRSTNTFAADTWQHLRLDVIVQGNGDVILQVFRNNLANQAVGAPLWESVPGMEGTNPSQVSGFVDDKLGVNTGTVPLTAGFIGFGCRFEAANRAAYVDHVTVDRQIG